MKVELTEVPRLETMVTQATRIKANITAYSTAVGPSSETRNVRVAFKIEVMIGPSLKSKVNRV